MTVIHSNIMNNESKGKILALKEEVEKEIETLGNHTLKIAEIATSIGSDPETISQYNFECGRRIAFIQMSKKLEELLKK